MRYTDFPFFISKPSEFKKLSAKPFFHFFSLFLLACAGVLGNLLKLPVMYGVEILFGNVAIIMSVILYGPLLGLVVAAIAAIPTLFFWGHPYFIFICMAEALFVGYSMRHLWSGALLASIIYWLVPGGFLIWLTYRYLMGMPSQGTLLIWLKQSVNGIFDVLIANSVLTFYRLVSERRSGKASMSFDRAIFNVVIAMVFVPALLVLIFTSRGKMREIENEVVERVTNLSNNLQLFIDTWSKSRIHIIQQIANTAEKSPDTNSQELQKEVEILKAAPFGFQSIYVANSLGNAFVFDPKITLTGESSVGLNFSDREYFKKSRLEKKPFITDLFIGRGTTVDPIMSVVVPIFKNNNFQGIAAGASSSEALEAALRRYAFNEDVSITIVDSKNQVIASSIKSVRPMTDEFSVWNGDFKKINAKGVYVRRPIAIGPTPAALRWKNSFYGIKKSTAVPNWSLITEASIAPYIENIEMFYIENFFLILCLCLSGLFFSYLVSRLVTKPIHALGKVTSNLPERVERDIKIDWPETRLNEIQSLVENFKFMTAALNSRFNALNLEISQHAIAQAKLKEAMTIAETANKAKSTFLANMSHEIRTPLSAVLGYSEMLAEPKMTMTDRKNAMSAIARNGDQLQRLIDDILDFSKVEAGQLKLERKKTSIDEIISGGIEVLKSTAQEKNLKLCVESKSDVPDFFETDPTRLRQVLLNLVGNAVKFTEAGGVSVKVEFIKSSQSSGLLKFEVSDTGIGLSEQNRKSLFQPFGQVDVSMTRRFGGTGLGLVLSRRLARSMGGDVQLVDCELGRGCTFEASVAVNLPPGAKVYSSLAEARKVAKEQASTAKELAPLNGLNILLVEDSVDVRFLITTVLKKLNGNVEEADSGLEGVRKALSQKFDIVLMDVQMPEMDGLEAVQVLRSKGYKGPIVALIAHALQEHRDRCLQAGFSAYLTKPVNFFELSHKIIELTQSK